MSPSTDCIRVLVSIMTRSVPIRYWRIPRRRIEAKAQAAAVSTVWRGSTPPRLQAPTTGTYGNMGVASLRGPGFWEWDQTVSRQFRITENQHLELRAEAFNVTNSVRFNLPVSGGNSLQVGNGHVGVPSLPRLPLRGPLARRATAGESCSWPLNTYFRRSKKGGRPGALARDSRLASC